MSKEKLLKRDFGGRKRHDWFKLHENIDKSKGLTIEQASSLAQALRDDGYAVKIDPLGGKGRKGVYYRKAKKRSTLWVYNDVELFTIPKSILSNWFKKRTGTSQNPYYESTVSNFIAQNPHLICGCDKEDVYVWREMRLGSGTKRDASRVDVVIETRKELWIIEAKYTEAFDGIGPAKNAIDEVRDYYGKLLKLGWWKLKTKIMAIVWAVYDKVPETHRELFESHQIETG